MVDHDQDRGWDRPGTCVEELLAKRTVELILCEPGCGFGRGMAASLANFFPTVDESGPGKEQQAGLADYC